MSAEERIAEVTRILYVHERNSKADLAKKIVKALEEAPTDDLAPGDICEVWNEGRGSMLGFYCGKDNLERKTFSADKAEVGCPQVAPYFDHYRKLDVFDVLSADAHSVDVHDVRHMRIKRIIRPEGR
jgi:hypothetical protein